MFEHLRQHIPLFHKQADDKIGIAESLISYITRARLTACKVGIFREKYANGRST